MRNQIISVLILGVFMNFSCSKDKSISKTDNEVKNPKENETLPVVKGVLVSADGKTNTYTLINQFLAGTGDVIEAPDCSHLIFGPHITQVFDKDLNKNVFAFHIHLSPDNDKCEDSDRQRNEIKTYDRSPDSLKATLNETIEYNWKFKLDEGFKPSGDFTHLHQIKPIDGNSGLPIITLTARYKSSGETFELIHTGDTENSSLKYLASVPLKDFKGHWVEVKEKITYATKGKHEIVITRISDNKILLNKKTEGLDMWRTGTTNCRPKWGIYRRILDKSRLRDETVLFNDFEIIEIK